MSNTQYSNTSIQIFLEWIERHRRREETVGLETSNEKLKVISIYRIVRNLKYVNREGGAPPFSLPLARGRQSCWKKRTRITDPLSVDVKKIKGEGSSIASRCKNLLCRKTLAMVERRISGRQFRNLEQSPPSGKRRKAYQIFSNQLASRLAIKLLTLK